MVRFITNLSSIFDFVAATGVPFTNTSKLVTRSSPVLSAKSLLIIVKSTSVSILLLLVVALKLRSTLYPIGPNKINLVPAVLTVKGLKLIGLII